MQILVILLYYMIISVDYFSDGRKIFCSMFVWNMCDVYAYHTVWLLS